jgi:hypothetical protein
MERPFDPLNPMVSGTAEPRKRPARRRRAEHGSQGHLASILHEWRRGGHLAALKGGDAAVLLCLVSKANFGEDVVTTGGREAIAKAVGRHPRSVRRSIDALVDAGFLERLGASIGGVAKYRIRCPESAS